MITYHGNNVEGVYTLSEFLEAVNAPAYCEDNQRELEDWLTDDRLKWMGISEDARSGENSFDATRRLVRDGWARGVKLIDSVVNSVTVPAPRSVRRAPMWRGQGDEIDQQRVWAGNLDRAWRTTGRERRNGPCRVRLIVDSIANAGVDAKDMRWRGVAALRLTDVLTEAGYSVQVEGAINAKGGCGYSGRFKLRTIVKEYTQPLDLLTLAATTAMPAFFRSLMHTWGMVVADRERIGVGYNVEHINIDDFVDEQDNAHAFVLSGSIDSADDATKAIAAVIAKLDSLA